MASDPSQASYGSLPFDEAIRFFRQKVNLPTRRWDDIQRGAHARAFVVAGANRDDVLAGLRAAVDKAISQGTALEEFRKDFDATVRATGWSYNGARGWRTGVIFRTNVRTAYQAGRHAQMQELRATHPYWMYKHGDSQTPRPAHLAWNGLVLPQDDPWWSTHFPPNGWGCTCRVVPVSRAELKAMGKDGPDTPPSGGTYTWTDSAGQEHQVPTGIDPGWDYNVGEAAWGRPIAEKALAEQAGGKWRDLGPVRGPADYQRPEQVPADTPVAQLGPPARDEEQLRGRLREAIGGEQAVYNDPWGASVLVDQTLADHVLGAAKRADGRERYFPLIREVIEQPYEIWAAFAENELTGQVGLRRRYVKQVRLSKDHVVALVADAQGGVWTSFTFFRGGESALGNLRKGVLVWGR
jgi:SPP1 gp7 family putative phage head morphogenesis protein